MGCLRVAWLLSLSKLVYLALISGPNNLNLFQPVDPASSTQFVLNDLSLKLVLFYNSKVSILKYIVVHCNAISPTEDIDINTQGTRCTRWEMCTLA